MVLVDAMDWSEIKKRIVSAETISGNTVFLKSYEENKVTTWSYGWKSQGGFLLSDCDLEFFLYATRQGALNLQKLWGHFFFR